MDSTRGDARDTTVNRLGGWRRVAVTLLGWMMRAWGASLRFEASPASLQNLTRADQPTAIVLWHNRLFLAGEIVRRYRGQRPVYALVSASRDGALLEAFFAMVHMKTIRGSSSRLGREAALRLVEALRSGADVGITPDGPRGPRYDFKAGGVVVARRAQVPVLLLGGMFESAWQLPSWDGFFVPVPFSRVRMTGEYISSEELSDRDATVTRMASRLREINDDTQAHARFDVI